MGKDSKTCITGAVRAHLNDRRYHGHSVAVNLRTFFDQLTADSYDPFFDEDDELYDDDQFALPRQEGQGKALRDDEVKGR